MSTDPTDHDTAALIATPRTDAAIVRPNPLGFHFVPLHVSRKLERELAAVTADREKIRDWGIRCQNEMEHQSRLFMDMKAQRDTLLSTLRGLFYAADVFAADQTRAPHPSCGMVQPVSVEEGEQLNAALKAAAAAIAATEAKR